MLRQDHSEGSSTSRSFAKTVLLWARRKTFQFSTEQRPRYIFFGEPLFLMPVRPSPSHRDSFANRVARQSQQIGSPRVVARFSFEGTTFPPSFRPRLISRETGIKLAGGSALFFQGTAFPQSFRPRLLSTKPQDRDRRTIFRGNHFSLFPLVSRMPLAEPRDFPQQFFL
jgi:hypothetical protein